MHWAGTWTRPTQCRRLEGGSLAGGPQQLLQFPHRKDENDNKASSFVGLLGGQAVSDERMVSACYPWVTELSFLLTTHPGLEKRDIEE